MSVVHLPPDTGVDEIAIVLERDGCAIIDRLATAAEVGRLRGELEPYFERRTPCTGPFFGYHTRRVESLIVKSPTVRELAVRAVILAVMNRVLGPHCERYQLNLTQAIRVEPGERAQLLHTDDGLFPFDHPGIECMVNCIWAYDRFTAANGGTRLVPGSHRWPAERETKAGEIVAAEMDPGSVLVYLGSLRHGGGANVTDGPRTGVVISYCLGWLRQSENQYLSAPPEIARHFDKPLQDLLGYIVHRPNLGWVEGREPSDLFAIPRSRLADGGSADFLTDSQNEMLRRHYAADTGPDPS
jgi:ectoine hydroxylase-related dioxygenase (phytanoyl-CoA dioxygenase family)